MAGIGACAGGVLSKVWDSRRRRRLFAQREALYEAAMGEAEGLVEASRSVCETQLLKLRDKWTLEFARLEQRLTDYAVELRQREELSALREDDLRRTEAEIGDLAVHLGKLEGDAMVAQEHANAMPARWVAALSVQCERNSQTVLQDLVRMYVETATLHSQIEARQMEMRTEERASTDAKRLLTLAMDRYHGVGHMERIQNTFSFAQNPGLAPLRDAEGPLHLAFVQASGCELWHDGEQSTLTVRGDDPLSREVGRRLMRQLERRPKTNVAQLQHDARKIRDAVGHEVQTAGREAFRILGLPLAAPEVVELVGRLQFRLSYSQNQWKHAVEVAHLCGMVAAELGLDVALAKRGGLLHDIGKALTHEREGSHAVLGAEVARRCGEDERVCNAIGAHHNDEPVTSPVAYVVAACDAVSGARPGARRDTVTQYLTQLHDLQRIASQAAAVRRVDIMQGGREVRVVVSGATKGDVEPSEMVQGPVLPDDALYPLAQRIARDIEASLVYAGQIRVTVIRESRAVSIAY